MLVRKSQTGNPLTTTGCVGDPPAILLLAQRHELQLVESTRVGSVIRGTGLYLTKWECEQITSFFVITRTNLLSSYCTTYAQGGIESVDLSNFLSSLIPQTSNIGEGDTNPSVTPQHEYMTVGALKKKLSAYRIVWNKLRQSKYGTVREVNCYPLLY